MSVFDARRACQAMQSMEQLALLAIKFTLALASPWSNIAGYTPGSQVTSHNAIDLDQAAIEDALKATTIDWNLVRNLYTLGGNSKTYAEFTLQPGLPSAAKKGNTVTGTVSGIVGSMYADYDIGTTTIRVAYPTSDDQARYVDCKVGALTEAPGGNAQVLGIYRYTASCYLQENLTIVTSTGTVQVSPAAAPFHKAGRTLQGFSTKAEGTMYSRGSNGGCSGASDRSTDGCPYFDFTQYYNYYKSYNYADIFVLAAINGASTSFGNALADMNFQGRPNSMRIQGIKKGTAYMNAYMYAIREFEDAIDDCKAGCPNGAEDASQGDCNDLSIAAVHAWDEGVAFYTGTREGSSLGGNTNGVMSYRLAEKRCENFKTCGASGDALSGTSYVNSKIFEHLATGKNNLLAGKCEETRALVRQMVALMAVPLIQGTLRYAYKVSKLSGGDTEKAEGAVFAAAIVPRVNYCNAIDAATIMNNMKIGAPSTSFAAVKTAFENNYACMNITCANVGGLWEAEAYYADAEPCPMGGGGSTSTAFTILATWPSSAALLSIIVQCVAWLA